MIIPKFTVKRFTDFSIAFFMVTVVGFYYSSYMSVIWIGYFILAIALTLNLLYHKNCGSSGAQMIGLMLLFVFWSFMTSLWAYDYTYTIDKLNLLFKTITVTIMLAILLTSLKRVDLALYWLSVGAVIYGLIYLSYVDLSKLSTARIAATSSSSDIGGLPNYNVVSLYDALAAIYFMGKTLQKDLSNKYYKVATLILLLTAVACVFIFGSRKSIIMLVFGFLCFLLGSNIKSSMRLRLLILCAVAVVIALILLPDSYVQYIFSRFTGLGNSQGNLDAGDKGRVKLLKYGLEFMTIHPVWGIGFFNFTPLMGNTTGDYLYAHNNFIETITDIGIIGFIIYYSASFIPLKKGYRLAKNNIFIKTLLVMSVVNIIGQIFIVTLLDRVSWLLITIVYIGVGIACRNNKTSFLQQSYA